MRISHLPSPRLVNLHSRSRESHLFTRLIFTLGSWDPLPLGLKRSMEAARMRVFRMILGEFRKEGGLSDRAVRCMLPGLPGKPRLCSMPYFIMWER